MEKPSKRIDLLRENPELKAEPKEQESVKSSTFLKLLRTKFQNAVLILIPLIALSLIPRKAETDECVGVGDYVNSELRIINLGDGSSETVDLDGEVCTDLNYIPPTENHGEMLVCPLETSVAFITRIRTNSPTINFVDVGGDPAKLAYNLETDQLTIPLFDTGDVLICDTASIAFDEDISSCITLDFIYSVKAADIDPDDDYAVVTAFFITDFAVYRLSTESQEGTVDIENPDEHEVLPLDLSLDRDLDIAFLVINDADYVAYIDVDFSNPSLIGTLPVGYMPIDSQLASSRGLIFLSNYGDGTFMEIDTSVIPPNEEDSIVNTSSADGYTFLAIDPEENVLFTTLSTGHVVGLDLDNGYNPIYGPYEAGSYPGVVDDIPNGEDGDEDGYPNQVAMQPDGSDYGVSDCDDEDDSRYPGATEYCDDVDQDCDGDINDPEAIGGTTYYQDSDGDNWGNSEVTTTACDLPDGYAEIGGDCDDQDANTYPGATDPVDEVDQNCETDPPVIELEVDVNEIEVGGQTGLTAHLSDPDGDIRWSSVNWKLEGEGQIINQEHSTEGAEGTATAVFQAPDAPATVKITLEVEDEEGNKTEEEVWIRVYEEEEDDTEEETPEEPEPPSCGGCDTGKSGSNNPETAAGLTFLFGVYLTLRRKFEKLLKKF